MIYRHEGRGIVEATKGKFSVNAASVIVDDMIRQKRDEERAIAAAERQKKWRGLKKCD